jgi:hypothetical protein
MISSPVPGGVQHENAVVLHRFNQQSKQVGVGVALRGNKGFPVVIVLVHQFLSGAISRCGATIRSLVSELHRLHGLESKGSTRELPAGSVSRIDGGRHFLELFREFVRVEGLLKDRESAPVAQVALRIDSASPVMKQARIWWLRCWRAERVVGPS